MIDVLKKINLFENLSETDLERVLALCIKQAFPKDAVIFREGDPGDRCYIITGGAVRISKFIPNIGEEALAVLKPGDYFGEMALIDNFPRSATAVTNDDADVFSISKPDLDRVLIADRDLGYKLLWTFTRTLSRRLRETNDKLTGFLALSGGI